MKSQSEKQKKINYIYAPFIFIFGIALFGACGPPDNTRGTQAQKGFEHFKEYCVSCHGTDGRGIELDSLGIQPADLTRITVRRRLNSFPIMEVAKIIDGRIQLKAHGPRPMPIWGDVFSKQKFMTEDEIRGDLGELIAYLMKIQRTR